MGSIRQGLPHLYSELTAKGNLTPSLSVQQFADLTADGHIHIHNVTEKTDGMTFIVGKDHDGFFTIHSGSGVVPARNGIDHITRAKQKAKIRGVDYDATFAESLAEIHTRLQINKFLQQYLSYHPRIGIQGELLNRALGTYDPMSNEMKFVHTPYRTDTMGSLGSFIVHTQLPQNHLIKELDVTPFGDKYVTFDHDIVDFAGCSVDVKEELQSFNALDHSLIMSRTTPKNKAQKVAENEVFNEIKKSVSKKVVDSISIVGIENKWGTGSEGIVVHPCDLNQRAPRFKITTDGFKQAKVNSVRF